MRIMKTSWIIGIFAFIVLLLGGWYWRSLSHGQSSAPAQSAAVKASTSTGADIGGNLALGENSKPSVGKYLIAYNGMTLYTYSGDSAGVSKCSGLCGVNWLPYSVSSASGLVAEYPISGSVGTLLRSDGSLQLTYNGIPLYFYSGDEKSGDVTGNGFNGAWFVAKP